MYNRKTVEDHLGNRFESITAMCKFWDITESIFRNRVRLGWSLEEALTIKPGKKPKKTGKTCKDHLGNTYISIEEMCKAYNISANAYCARIRLGWSLEEALTKKLYDFSCKDHLGKEYETTQEMCKAYNIPKTTFEQRIKKGWPLEKALTGEKHMERICKDHLGNTYKSVPEMCKVYGINRQTYEVRVKSGLSVEEALTKDLRTFKCKDHLGNEYKSIDEMCKVYGIPRATYDKHIKKGWTIKKTLMQKKLNYPNKGCKCQCKDHLGNKYDTKKEMCDAYNISSSLYNSRIRHGWTIKDALTRKQRDCTCKDHLGNEYSSIEEMCKAYGIDTSVYYFRIRKGLTLKEALTNKTRTCTCKDHLGKEYRSIAEMCRKYSITKSMYDTRIKNKWPLEKILTQETCRKIHKDHLGNEYKTFKEMCDAYEIKVKTYNARINKGWSVEEALTIPKNMYIGEYRVAEKLKKMHKKFYYDCSIKAVFEELDITVDWKDFLNELQKNLGKAGYNRSVQKIQILRPDFVVYTDEDNKIQGVIEFDGEQHQNFVEFFYKTIEQFYKRNNADMAKQSLFEYLNIPMLRIRHDQVDLIDEMIEDFIEFPENYITRHNTYLTEDEYWSILREEKKKLDLVFA